MHRKVKAKALLKNKIIEKIIGQVVLFNKALPYSSKVLYTGILFFLVSIILNLTSPKKSDKSSYKPLLTATDTSDFIQEQIQFLNNKTPISLSYNSQVEEYIDLFLTDRSKDLSLYLGRSELYFPIIESCLDKYNLPLELKYLAVIESGLNPRAKSKSGAVGIWQFLYNTCFLVDLQVTSYIDERCDVYKSTDAACRYLKYLYNIFNNWDLAISAYNGGPGAIHKAIERSGGKTNFWEIQSYLPEQTAKYLPAFIAMNFLFENPGFHNAEIIKTVYSFSDIDTLIIKTPIHFRQLAAGLNFDIELIQELNPVYRKQFIPALKNGATLVLPKSQLKKYLKNKDFIHALDPEDFSRAVNLNDTINKTCIIHTVKKGDFYHKIAMQYNCTIQNIKKWNDLDSLVIFPGQQLKIWIEPQI